MTSLIAMAKRLGAQWVTAAFDPVERRVTYVARWSTPGGERDVEIVIAVSDDASIQASYELAETKLRARAP